MKGVRASLASAPARMALLAAIALGCGAEGEPSVTVQPLIYGVDDRLEFHQVADANVRNAMASSMVAILPRDGLARLLTGSAEALGERAQLCAGEPFADQPAAALCTGVLVDWDLVLTAGHCVRVLPLDELVAVFDYFYRTPGELQLERASAFDLQEIAAEALSAQDQATRLDFAFIRLRHAAEPPRAPIPIRARVAEADASLVALTAGAGVPIKADLGGRVRDARALTRDYFVADTDTSGGSSGGAAFDARMALLGILARGGRDLETTEAGCSRALRAEDGGAEEQFTYAAAALEQLCREVPHASSLCRADCGAVCEALPAPESQPAGGCAVRTEARTGAGPLLIAAVLAGAIRWRSQHAKQRQKCGIATVGSAGAELRQRAARGSRRRSDARGARP
jgi:hypothetical protein